MQRYNVSLVSLPFELACPIALPNILAATQSLPSNKAPCIDHVKKRDASHYSRSPCINYTGSNPIFPKVGV